MTARIIDGKAVAAQVVETVKARRRRRSLTLNGMTPGLAVVLVGEDAASQVYVASKGNAWPRPAAFIPSSTRLPAATQPGRTLALIETLNADPAIHGILVQLPLPGDLDERATIAAIDPGKDVDGLH